MARPRLLSALGLLALLVACEDRSVPVEGTRVGDCADGADNDGDGRFDCADSSCAASPRCAGRSALPDVDASLDNTGGLCTADSDCDSGHCAEVGCAVRDGSGAATHEMVERRCVAAGWACLGCRDGECQLNHECHCGYPGCARMQAQCLPSSP